MPELKQDLTIIEPKLTEIKKEPAEQEQSLFPVRVDLGDREQEITNTVYNEIEKAFTDLGDLPNQKRAWVDLCEGNVPEKDFPFVGCANVAAASAVVGAICEGYHHRIMSSIFGGNYVWIARALPGANPDEAELAQEYLHYVQNVQMKLESSFDDGIMDFTKTGNITAFLEWSYKTEKTHDVENYETLEALVEENGKQIPEDGKIEEGYVRVDDQWQIQKEYEPFAIKLVNGEKSVDVPVEYNRAVEDHPKLLFIDWDDFFVSGGKDAHKDLNKARVVGHKLNLRWENLKQDAWKDEDGKKTDNRVGIYFNLDKIKEAYPDVEKDKITDKETYKNIDYDIRRCLFRIDINGDGFEELCVFSIEWEKKILIQADYYQYWHNKCNYIPIRGIPKNVNKLYCLSIPQVLMNLSDEYDKKTNQQLDNDTLANTVQFEGIEGSSAQEEFESGGFYPGVVWWFESFDEIRQMKIQHNPIETLEAKKELKLLMETRTGYSQYFSGQTPANDSKAPASKTAMMLKEALTKVEDMIKRIRRDPLREIAYQVWELSYQFMSNERSFGKRQRTGQFEAAKISRSQMNRHNLDFIPIATSAKMNRELDKQLTNEFIMTMQSAPEIFGHVLQNPQATREIAESAIRLQGDEWASKLDKILPSEEEVREQQIEIEMEAQRRLQQEQQEEQELRDQGVPEEQIQEAKQELAAQDEKEQAKSQPKNTQRR